MSRRPIARVPTELVRTCPDCGATSYNRVDVLTGWCARCRKFTATSPDRVHDAMASLLHSGELGAARAVAYRLVAEGTTSPRLSSLRRAVNRCRRAAK